MRGASETVTLGQLVKWLERLKSDAEVVFDFCGASPSGIDSSRGDYAELALRFSFEKRITASALLKICEDAVGQTFIGYKGGHFTMDSKTQVWVDQYGRWTGTAITGFRDDDWQGMILTANVR